MGYVDKIARRQAIVSERGFILGDPEFIVTAAFNVVVGHSRQAFSRHAPEIGNADSPVENHGQRLSSIMAISSIALLF